MPDFNNNDEYTYFDPDDTQEYVPLPRGKYSAHITNVELKRENLSINSRSNPGAKHLCDIYNVTYEIDPSISNLTLRDDEGNEHPGSNFSGRKVLSKGFFLFKNPNGREDHLPNPGGNARMHFLLKASGYPIDKAVIEDDTGNKKEVERLPVYLDGDKMVGKPVIINVVHEEWTDKEGEEKITPKESGVSEWKEGQAIELETDTEDLPF
jgi:hypothetical protein